MGIVTAVADAKSPTEALSAATAAIAEAMGGDACIIFVGRPTDGFEPRARFGREVEPAVLVLMQALVEKAVSEVLPARSSSSAGSLVVVPVALINQTIGAIAVLRPAALPFTTEEIMRLSGVGAEIVQLIASVRLFETIDASGPVLRAPDSEPPPSTGERILRGIGASPGFAIGAATFRNTFPRSLARRAKEFLGPVAEQARARDAFEKTRNDLLRLQSAAASEIGEEQALIFGAHLLLLNDPMFTDLVDRGSPPRSRPPSRSTTRSGRSRAGYEKRGIPTFRNASRMSRTCGVACSVTSSRH